MSQELIDRITNLQQQMWRELEEIQNRMQQRAAQSGAKKPQCEYQMSSPTQIQPIQYEPEANDDRNCVYPDVQINEQSPETSYPIPRTPNNEHESVQITSTPQNPETQAYAEIHEAAEERAEECEELQRTELDEKSVQGCQQQIEQEPQSNQQEDTLSANELEELPPEVDVPQPAPPAASDPVQSQELPEEHISENENQKSEQHLSEEHVSQQDFPTEDLAAQDARPQEQDPEPPVEELNELENLEMPDCGDVPDDLPPPPDE